MLGRPVLQRTFVLVLAAAGICGACGAAAQPSASSAAAQFAVHPQATPASAGSSDDMKMPDDLGAPMSGTGPTPASSDQASSGETQRLSVNTPIDVIAASPQGKAVLEHDLPGLCERPEYVMFRTMTPAKLALLSNGRISRSKLTRLQAHLVRVSVATPAEPPHHGLLAESGAQVKRFSRAVYRKVLSTIESL